MQNKDKIYLFGFEESELIELFEALSLRDELSSRFSHQNNAFDGSEDTLLKKIGSQFSTKTAGRLKEEIIELLDEYLDNQIDDELMWQKIEEELKKSHGE